MTTEASYTVEDLMVDCEILVSAGLARRVPFDGVNPFPAYELTREGKIYAVCSASPHAKGEA